MKKTRMKIAVLLVCVMTLMFGMTVYATDAEGAEEIVQTVEYSEDDMAVALDYVDNYDSNLMADGDSFESNLTNAVTVIRSDVEIYATFLSLLPPLIAIVLALITKEVYMSLFIGILSAAMTSR